MGDARHAIEALIHEYAARIDAGDFAGVADLFAHATYRAAAGDGVAEFTGPQVAGLLEGMVIRYEDGTPHTQHVMTNVVVDVDDTGGTATSRCRFHVLQATPGRRQIETVAAGRYVDRFERVAGEWRFADRLIHTDLVGDVSHHLRVDPFTPLRNGDPADLC